MTLANVALVDKLSKAHDAEVLRGDLADIGLATLLQIIRMEAMSGWIRVAGRGAITLLKGQVIGATCKNLREHEALRELLFTTHGAFTVVRGEPGAAPPVEGVHFAVMDVYRLRDAWEGLAGARLRPPEGASWRPTNTALDAVMARLDGSRTVAAAILAAGAPPTLVIDAILEALEIGTLIPETIVAPTTTADDDFHGLLDLAHAAMRRAEYASAEALLRRALVLRPDDRVAHQNLRRLGQIQALHS